MWIRRGVPEFLVIIYLYQRFKLYNLSIQLSDCGLK
jgi:hypothetical protein